MRWASVTQYRCPNSFPMVSLSIFLANKLAIFWRQTQPLEQALFPDSIALQVAILVHVQPADSADGQHYELMNCSVTTSIQQIKAHVSNNVLHLIIGLLVSDPSTSAAVLQIAKLGIESGRYTLPVEEQVSNSVCRSFVLEPEQQLKTSGTGDGIP